MSVKLHNFRFPVYKGVPFPWMKWNSSCNDECRPSILFWKVSHFEKCALNYTTLGFPFIRGFPPMDEVKIIILRWVQTQYRCLKSFTFLKVHLKLYNFRVPVYKGVPLLWMKWNPSFNDECRPSVLVWTVSLSDKCMLNNATLESPFIRGFPSHGWNETHPLTMTAGQLY